MVNRRGGRKRNRLGEFLRAMLSVWATQREATHFAMFFVFEALAACVNGVYIPSCAEHGTP
jgi:hypothetical protein